MKEFDMRRQPEKTARTKQNMIDVFWKLAEEKGLDKVTASALAKEAGINRATFYAYFTEIGRASCRERV